MAKLDQTIQAIPLDPRLCDPPTGDSIDADGVSGQYPARGRKRTQRPLLPALDVGMNCHLITLGQKEVDGFVRVGERSELASQVFTQLVTIANLRLTEGAAVTDKIRRYKFIKAWPVLLIDCLDERSDD